MKLFCFEKSKIGKNRLVKSAVYAANLWIEVKGEKENVVKWKGKQGEIGCFLHLGADLMRKQIMVIN